jgi:hypothetical protein
MAKSFAVKNLSVVAMAVVLAHLSPVATGMLLCIADGADPGCCREPDAALSGVNEQLLDDSDCSCCIAIDAAPSTAGTTYQKASLDVLSGSGLLRNAVSATETRVSRVAGHDPGDSRLSSLRTVVLLI